MHLEVKATDCQGTVCILYFDSFCWPFANHEFREKSTQQWYNTAFVQYLWKETAYQQLNLIKNA